MSKTIVKFGWSDAYAIDNDKVHLFLKAFEGALRVNDSYVKGHDGSFWYVCNQQVFPRMEMLNNDSLISEDTLDHMKAEAEQNGA